jgi:DNA-binding SARP family transcriptional activator
VDITGRFRVTLLDGFALRSEERPEPRLTDVAPGLQRLVAYLCLSGRPARTAVAGQLWPEVSEEHAHASLRSAVWRLARIAPGLVEASKGALRLAPGVSVDVHDLRSWCERVLQPQVPAAEVLWPDPALQGDLLPGWYDDWLLLEREQLRQLRMHALEAVATRLADVGHYGAAVQAAHLALRADPLRETAHRTLVRLHLAEGNVADAVRAYRRFREMLHDELGVLPTARMTQLFEQVDGARLAAS